MTWGSPVHSPRDIEVERLLIQKSLDDERTPGERNEMGQFATPPALAEDIISLVLDMNLPTEFDFIEPSCGSGSFYSALLRMAGDHRIRSARGVEIDTRFAAAATRLWSGTGFDVEAADYTRWSASTEEKFDLLVANPPYVRHHHLDAALKSQLAARAMNELGLRPSGLSGLYVHFILASHRSLRPDALSAWLIPAEFMDVNYGEVLRTYLASRVTLISIHTFDPADVQFEGALVSSAVVVFRNSTPSSGDKALFTYGGTLAHPREERLVPISGLDPKSKWSSIRRRSEIDWDGPTLADFFVIRRGIATGANGFFVIDRSEAVDRGFDEMHLTPMLPSPRHIDGVVVDTDRTGWPILDRQRALVDCRLPEDEVAAADPALAHYFATADALGIRDRYLLKNRRPWYRQEERFPAPFLCTYMGRAANEDRPFRFILNRSRAIATNVYLMLYPRRVLSQFLDDNPRRLDSVHQALLAVTSDEQRHGGRVYGGGLHKIEPKELGSLPAERLIALDAQLLTPSSDQDQLQLALG